MKHSFKLVVPGILIGTLLFGWWLHHGPIKSGSAGPMSPPPELDARHVAFVVAPAIRPQLPVAVDSRSVEEWTESGWGRFDKWENLQALRLETSPYLEKLAGSNGYLEVARGQARLTVEEFVADWLLKVRGWPEDSQRFVKVYFADEPDIPFPDKKSLKDFLP